VRLGHAGAGHHHVTALHQLPQPPLVGRPHQLDADGGGVAGHVVAGIAGVAGVTRIAGRAGIARGVVHGDDPCATVVEVASDRLAGHAHADDEGRFGDHASGTRHSGPADR
jgi:hypothetical protein